MFAPHPVPIIYASAPILKPKPIRPTINTNVQPASFNRPLPQPKPLRRPSLLRASTLGVTFRSQYEHEITDLDQRRVPIKPAFTKDVIRRTASILGHSDHSHHSHHHHHYPRLPSDASRNDPYFPDPYSYDLK
ncbi:hypothetical protein PSTT_13961 [Puccinia striiformis]|uniref:Uncharacterized protein n=1 Tax=Puccinia striiformis TaxID=27350 RepID=A0A2S4UPM0_9BASI|nr:hypothetical protein PSTT_13961 [Puccinia striiformis]